MENSETSATQAVRLQVTSLRAPGKPTCFPISYLLSLLLGEFGNLLGHIHSTQEQKEAWKSIIAKGYLTVS